MSDATPTPGPVVVPTTVSAGLGYQGLRVVLVGLCAVLCDRFVHNGLLIPAVMSGAGVVATWAVGAVAHVRTINLFKRINNVVSDRLVKAKS